MSTTTAPNSTTLDPSSKIPHWFALILSTIALGGGGAWLAGEHGRVTELERRIGAAEIEAGKRGAQLDDIREALKDLKATASRTETTSAQTYAHVGDLEVKIAALTAATRPR